MQRPYLRLLLLVAPTLCCLVTFADNKVHIDKQNCTISKDDKTFPIHGKVKIVDNFEDLRVKLVDNFEHIRVKIVDNFADDCGKVKIVTNFEDVRIKIVDNFEDVRVKVVENFPGISRDTN